MNAAPAPPSPARAPAVPSPALLAFWRALAVQVRRGDGPHAAEARQLVRLIKLYRSLREQAEDGDGPHAALAEGLAGAVMPAIVAAAGRLRLM